MGWKDLLQKKDETIILPWIGGRTLYSKTRIWKIIGKIPQDHGWYEFNIEGNSAFFKNYVERPNEFENMVSGSFVKGYLIGDRIISDDVSVSFNKQNIIKCSTPLHLIESGLDKFVRIIAGKIHSSGPLFYFHQDMPLGPESEVLEAFLDGKNSVSHIKGVLPSLDAAFRMEVWQKAEIERRRVEAERLYQEEIEKLLREERRQELLKSFGDGAKRREMALYDFPAAAKAALAVSGAELLDSRNSTNRNEMIIKFRFNGRKFECTCDARTFRIIDAGICLTAHDSYEFEDGTKGDTFFTLESLPGVIREAITEGKLVIFRHAYLKISYIIHIIEML